MHISMIMFVAAWLLVALACDQDAIPLPISYVTSENQLASDSGKQYFLANLCGGEHHDNQTATISLNQPGQEWSTMTGYYLKAVVRNTDKVIVGSNKKGASYIDTFSFQYKSEYKDLFIYIEDGEGPGTWPYTITLNFKSSDTDNSEETHQLPATRHVVSVEERMGRLYQEKYYDITFKQLIQVFKIEGDGQAKTFKPCLYRMDYCFEPVKYLYNITVSTIAVDDISAFGTYVCPKSEQPCSVRTPYRDTCGAPANFVLAHIKPEVDYGPVDAIVMGDGRFEKYNTYRIAASGYIPPKK